MPRDIKDLENNALKFWPETIAEMERGISVMPKLIETQDKFISLLNIADSNPFSWKTTLASSSLTPNMFLKHLMVLSDLGGEKLMRFKKELPSVFTDNLLRFTWKESQYDYTFQSLAETKTWNNNNLNVDGDRLSNSVELSSAMEDVINLILFGSTAITENIPVEIEEKCIIGTLIGNVDELDAFVRQRYIWVSRIIGGATANSLGNLAQKYVIEYLQEKLPSWDFSKKQIDNISQNERTNTSYDIVAKSPVNKYCAIEVSFQVTTNSVIERKAGQAQARQNQLHSAGHHIAYIIDGAGNFARSSALRTLCNYSDCTVTFNDIELDKLVEFLLSI